jgi:starch phosphorylase
MKSILSFNVRPSIPDKLAPLAELAFNLLWCWDHEQIALFRRLDEDLWERTSHNPIMMLSRISQDRFRELMEDEAFMEHLARATARFREYVANDHAWYKKFYSGSAPLFAYFSAEWGLTESLRIYSGGLGILAGDFLKSASDLGLPLVGVGLLYQEGYFRQYLNADGWQQERYDINDFFDIPVKAKTDCQGNPVTVSVKLNGRDVCIRCWTVDVGRVPLLLLDTNIPENTPEDRKITSQLYIADIDMRIRQEIVLGIGGVRMLKALGLEPVVYHMNEGHSAFLAIERAGQLMRDKHLSFEEAREVARSGSIFTTHTPVPAGIDEFPAWVIEAYFRDYVRDLGIGMDEFLGMGRLNPKQAGEPFNMARLAINEAAYVNGVSRLHMDVSRKMWWNMWGDIPFDEIPIGYVTNGIHIPSWVSHDMASLLDRYVGRSWVDRPTDQTVWEGVWKIPDSELWRTHERRRERLVAFARRSLGRQLRDQGAGREALKKAEEVLDPGALTIGFARRFATYKRATLLLTDPERLKRILTNPDRPVQMIFAGKAHPSDNHGKEFIRKIVHFAKQEGMRDRVVFIEDYDMVVSRYLVEGVDVWLNTPFRTMEASGTSGMKVVPNGGLNLSVLDGWWDEAYTPEVGWAIGRGEDYSDKDYQNQVESNALYHLLETEIVPLFYSRSRDGLPRDWIRMMKQSMRSLCPVFNTDRMVKEYVRNFYLPALDENARLLGDDLRTAREFAAWKARLHAGWAGLEIVTTEAEITGNEKVGSMVPVTARIKLGGLTPEDVTVEAYYGQVDKARRIRNGKAVEMKPDPCLADGTHLYRAMVPCEESGSRGLALRVVPSRIKASDPLRFGLIKWM